jgi:hypothetical protein
LSLVQRVCYEDSDGAAARALRELKKHRSGPELLDDVAVVLGIRRSREGEWWARSGTTSRARRYTSRSVRSSRVRAATGLRRVVRRSSEKLHLERLEEFIAAARKLYTTGSPPERELAADILMWFWTQAMRRATAGQETPGKSVRRRVAPEQLRKVVKKIPAKDRKKINDALRKGLKR